MKYLINIIHNQGRRFNINSRTPLHYTAINNSKDIFDILISKGINVNAKDI